MRFLNGHTIRDAITGLSAAVEARKQTPTGNALNVQIGPGDPISNIPVVMDFEHHQVHEGETYRAQDVQASLGVGTVKYSLAVPAASPAISPPHMVVSADIYNGAARVDIYAEATVAGGTAVPAHNRNRNSSNTATVAVKTGVTSTTGVLIESFYVAPGKNTSDGGRAASEYILKSGVSYRVDVVGLSAQTAAIIGFNWYEDLGL